MDGSACISVYFKNRQSLQRRRILFIIIIYTIQLRQHSNQSILFDWSTPKTEPLVLKKKTSCPASDWSTKTTSVLSFINRSNRDHRCQDSLNKQPLTKPQHSPNPLLAYPHSPLDHHRTHSCSGSSGKKSSRLLNHRWCDSQTHGSTRALGV